MHICSAKMVWKYLASWTCLFTFNLHVHTESHVSWSKWIYFGGTYTFKFFLDKISWQKSKICLRKPKCLVALILATLELSQWIKKTAKIKSQNLSMLPKALLKHFQTYWLHRDLQMGKKYIRPNPFMLANLSTIPLVKKPETKQQRHYRYLPQQCHSP